ncbi:MAG: hypothetical protein KC445_09065, partial [Anaerolineales bacterium]|nr:hypothetical protein [Anaerolineales bacterium]
MSTRASRDEAEAAGFEAPGIDLDNVNTGSTFQAKWGFKNTGTTTWGADYKFVYTLAPHSETANVPRSTLGSPSAQPLGQLANIRSVKPGETAWVTMHFTAPDEAGTFATNWQLQAANGQRFGPVRWMRLVVPQTTGTPLAYRMVAFKNSVANFNSMQPGQQFTAVWTLQNMGTAVWTGDFQIACLATGVPDTQTRTANPMGAPAVNTLRALTGRERVNPGETVDIEMRLTAPTTAGAYAFHWQMRSANGTAFGDVRWLIIGVGGQIPTENPIKPGSSKQVGFGMNVNINDGHPLDAERMNGLGWVRFVFWASRLKKTPEQAYQDRYRQIIQTYANQGIRSLIILHQDTHWGNAPWDNGGWDAYAQQFGEACGRVARVCSEFGDMVAYQIYNEQD